VCIRIEPVHVRAFMWFSFEINPRNVREHRLVYGEHE
jgi:hypothetical protein